MTTTIKILNDPMGAAILDFANSKINKDIIVLSDICEDDVIPSSYLFRTYDEMPELEQIALNHCSGKVLDVGAGAGVHASCLVNQGLSVTCIDTSKGSIEYLQSIGLDATLIDFHELKGHKYDTILMLMNGIGIAGDLEHLEHTLSHAKTLLSKTGKIICDSSDIKYLYEGDDGGLWIDLNSEYYGNFKFQMKYKEHLSESFNWLYVDFVTLKNTTDKLGFTIDKIYEENDQYLVEIKLK